MVSASRVAPNRHPSTSVSNSSATSVSATRSLSRYTAFFTLGRSHGASRRKNVSGLKWPWWGSFVPLSATSGFRKPSDMLGYGRCPTRESMVRCVRSRVSTTMS